MPYFGGIAAAAAEAIACNGTKFQAGEKKLDGCLASYGGGCAGGQRLPEEGSVLGPWVAVTFEGSGSTVTVGNNSSPNTNPRNVACIKSFEFGYSDGLTCRVVIHDEQGGSFVAFLGHILKNHFCTEKGISPNVRMKVRFGWCKSSCDAPIPVASSRCFYCLCDAIETNFSEGKFIFELTGKDLCHRMFEGAADKIYGGDGKDQIPITQAIRELLTNGPPPNIRSVRFCKMDGGSCKEAEFKINGKEGPKGKWIANGQDKMAIILRWLSTNPSKDDKGWIPQYNSEVPEGELIIWEDRKPKCNAEGDSYWDNNCIGTYVVNGGKKSPVLEFNPKIRWDFARLTGMGGALSSERANAMQNDGSKLEGGPCQTINKENNPGAGHTTQVTTTETAKMNGQTKKEQAEAINSSAKALRILHDSIEADLVIVGDPTILPPSEAMWSKNLTIILVNPYFLTAGGDTSCGEWLAKPVCNEVLSNKGWICKSISHRIESGKYTTTIGITLTDPGTSTDVNTPIGAWTGGWTPPPQC